MPKMKYGIKAQNQDTNALEVCTWQGINRLARPEDGYLLSACNVRTGDDGHIYPRYSRAQVRTITECDGFYADDTLIWVDGQKLYYGGSEISAITLTAGKKQILRLGEFLVILPDGIYYNLSGTGEYGHLSRDFYTEGAVSVSMTDTERRSLGSYYVTAELPEDAVAGDTCVLVKDGQEPVVMRYDGYSFKTLETLIKLSAAGIGAELKAGDTVECSGLEKYFGSYFTVAYCEANSVYVSGVTLSGGSVKGVRLKKEMPYYDHVTVSGNRMYAVRRGYDRNGDFVSRVYASAKGDPRNWSVYGDGLACDLDMFGEFTAICDYLGAPVAFTENALCEIREKGQGLALTRVIGHGVEKGAFQSCKTLGYSIYYKSREGVCKYDGSYPKLISKQISADLSVADCGAPSAVCNGKYYIKLSANKSKTAIFNYNPDENRWLCEDDPGVVEFAARGADLYALCENETGHRVVLMDYDNACADSRAYLCEGGEATKENDFLWYFESGMIGREIYESIYPIRLAIRCDVYEEGDVGVSLAYDDSVSFSEAARISGPRKGSFVLPVSPDRCDMMRVRFEGTGMACIKGYKLSYTTGGEVRGWR